MSRDRIDSIDLLRGLVIVLMGLDHVRNFFGPTAFRPEDLSQASAALFLTRWVTHFCAPVFLFLAGLGAALYQARGRSRAETAAFLAKRGLFLVLLEILVINPTYLSFWGGYMFVQVIWAIGWSMIALAGLLYLPRAAILAVSLAIVFGHHLLDGVDPATLGAAGAVVRMVRGFGWIPLSDGFGIMVIYSVLPWAGIMSLGYLFGRIFERPATERKRSLLAWGVVLTALFLLVRGLNLYGNLTPWEVSDRGPWFTVLSFLNANKYPASLAFVLMTLGPSLALLPYLERFRGKLSRALVTFGRVPLFFYVVHVPVIHVGAMLFSTWRYGYVAPPGSTYSFLGWYLRGPQAAPETYEPNLWLVWGVWVGVTVALYWPCKWFARVKRESASPLLSYL